MELDLKQLDREYIATTYQRFPLILKRGQGSLVYDENEREYIDMSTGIAVSTFGIGDAEWKDAVCAQLGLIQHTSNLYYSEPCARLAAMLCQRTGMNKVFFSNSGAEANECAIKVARKYAADNKGPEFYHIITLVNSFHGRTVTTLAATGQEVFHNDFTPLTEGFHYANAGDIEGLTALMDAYPTAAIMIEVVQGEGGVLPLDKEYVKALAALAASRDVLLICDEVQIGNGRSGMLYGYMNYGISPDIVTTAKGLGGGLPIGATLLSEKVQNVLTAGTHGSTFGGNPICCAGAISILSRLDETLLAGVRERSSYIIGELTGACGIRSISGMGLMLGVETVRPASEVISECMEKGLLVIKAKQKVRLLPALNIPMPLLKRAVEILKEVCASGQEGL